MAVNTTKKSAKYSERWQQENSVSEFIPYQTHIDEHTLKTRNGDYLQIIKLYHS